MLLRLAIAYLSFFVLQCGEKVATPSVDPIPESLRVQAPSDSVETATVREWATFRITHRATSGVHRTALVALTPFMACKDTSDADQAR